ncbi:MAG: MFS transporter, partial [Acidimicrobiales bacterium]|nr:MFS transporter [Acidimicrobiales bacterium]
DRRGPLPPYVLGVTCFGLGLVVAGLAPAMSVVVVGRVLQGLGAGAVPTVAYVAIGRALPESVQARMFAVLSTAWVVPGVFGPAVAAQVGRLVGWRWVFLGLVPLVAAAGLLACAGLRRLGPPAAESARDHRLVDGFRVAVGAGLGLAGLGAGRVAVGVPLLVVGAAIGLPSVRRLLPPGSARVAPGLPAAVVSRGVLTFAFFGGDAFVTLALVAARHWTVTWASLALTGATLSWTAGAWIQAHLHGRASPRQLVSAGFGFVLAGSLGMLAVVRDAAPVGVGVLAWTVAGLGMGLAYSPLSLLTLAEAPPGREGWATTSLNLADVLGTALGAGLGGAAVALGAHRGWTLAGGLTVVFAISIVVSLGGLAVCTRLPGRLSLPARAAAT